MKTFLLASTVCMAVGVSAHAQSLITQGQGTLTDAGGTQWQIIPNGSILETLPGGGQVWTPGGGGTMALTIVNGTVYGQDARTQDWFVLSGDDWAPSAAPAQSTAAVTSMPAGNVSSPPAAVPSGSIGSCPTTAAGAPSDGFHVVGGQIISPSGQPFIAKGINAGVTDLGDAAEMLADFPGLNFIRVSDNAYSPPGTFASFVNTMTAKGVVVEIEDHRASDGSGAGGEQGAVETGGGLAQEQAWFASLAQTFKGNPYVWLGTNNEPPGPGGALAQWITTTYQTIRGTGFANPIMMDAIGAFDTTGMPQNFAAAFTNVVWDAHYYGWLPQNRGVSTDTGLQQIVSSLQAIQSADGIIPVIVAEFGPSTNGMSPDANGNDVVESVVRAAATSPQSTRGSAAWHWGHTDCCNNITIGGQLTSPFGAAIALYIGTDPTASPNASIQTAAAGSCATQQAMAQTGPVILNAGPAPTPVILTAGPAPTSPPAAPTAAPQATLDQAYADQAAALAQTASDIGQAAAIATQAQTLSDSNAASNAALIAAATAKLKAVQALQSGAGQ